MQRRAAAVYVVFFLVVGAASYSLIATAEEPHIDFENSQHRYTQGDDFSVQGQQYSVASITAEVESGGGAHGGGGGGLVRSGEVAWTNDTALYTQSWDNGSTVTYDGDDWQVVIPNASDPSSFTLREEIDRAGILANDTSADNETVTRDGEEFVIITKNGNSTLVPAEDYFPTPEERDFSEGDRFQLDGNQTRIDVASDAVTFSWNAPMRMTASLGDEENVTLNGQTFLAVFPNNETVVLTQDFESYRAQTESIDQFHTQKNGLWGVSILSFVSIILLVTLAYVPSRY